MANSPKIFGTEGAQGDGLPEILQYFGIIIIISAVLILAFYIINLVFNKNLVLKWAIIGGVYALVPVLIALWSGGLHTAGEASPLYIMIFPAFWPLWLLTILSLIVIGFLIQWGIHIEDSFIEGASMILNVLWWILIGMLVGWLIQKRRAKKEKVR